MTDTAHNQPVHVTAEERPHPALQKLARALIALARMRHSETRNKEPGPQQSSSTDCGGAPERQRGGLS